MTTEPTLSSGKQPPWRPSHSLTNSLHPLFNLQPSDTLKPKVCGHLGSSPVSSPDHLTHSRVPFPLLNLCHGVQERPRCPSFSLELLRPLSPHKALRGRGNRYLISNRFFVFPKAKEPDLRPWFESGGASADGDALGWDQESVVMTNVSNQKVRPKRQGEKKRARVACSLPNPK